MYVEENSDGLNFITIDESKFQNIKLLSKYDFKTIRYHTNQVGMANLIYGYGSYMNGIIYIKDLTPKGHDFISNIRDEENYSNIQKIVNKTKSISLEIFIETAASYIANKLCR